MLFVKSYEIFKYLNKTIVNSNTSPQLSRASDVETNDNNIKAIGPIEYTDKQKKVYP